jgi:putative Ca2+/H+ antiporter (TMEM165/GDT1 family)
MRLFLKIVVYCIILALTVQSNLKRVNTQTRNQIFSNFTLNGVTNKPKKLILGSKQIVEPNLKWSYKNILIGEVGDKTFICITLLFFQTKTAYLMITSLLTKFLFIYLKILISQYTLFQFIPIEIFQVCGILIYNISGFAILYKLMFGNLKEAKDEYFIKHKNNEEYEKKFYFDIEDFVKIFGIVFVSQLAAFAMEYSCWHPFGISSSQDYDGTRVALSWEYLGIKFASISFGVLFAVIIGFLTYKKFSLELNLIMSAITFLLLGMDNAVKFFSVYNEWQV